MTPDVQPQPPSPLSPEERRVLGVLVEKQKTSKTADSYPLTLNSLTTGCNQKSNRDPVTDYTDDDVEEVLSGLQKKGLVMRMTGSRVDRFRHLLYEAWGVQKVELAVLAELLLRGPQTKGELRGRAGRMDPIDTLDDLENVLRALVERKLVIYLTPPDRRGAVLTHGFHTPDELTRLSSHHANAPADLEPLPPRPPTPPPGPDMTALLATADGEIRRLAATVSRLESRVSELEKWVGVAPPS
jgi:uncharacterized protein YceH (UPF0502 family)